MRKILNRQSTFSLIRATMLILIITSVLFTIACDRRTVDPNNIRVTDFIAMDGMDVLYQDNGATGINLFVQVRDNNQFPVHGQLLQFRSSVEQVRFSPVRVASDSAGIAITRVEVRGEALGRDVDSMFVTVGVYIGTRVQGELVFQIRRSPVITEVVFESR